MNDLQTIDRLNAEAVQRHVPELRRRGNTVVTEYTGLNFLGIHTFRGDNQDGTAAERAAACAKEINEQPGRRAEILAPIEVGAVEPVDSVPQTV